MNANVQALLDAVLAFPGTPWLGGAVLGGAIARLWRSLGGDAEQAPPPGRAGIAAVHELAERQRAAALRSTQLQLRTVAAEQQRLLCDTVLGNLQDGLVVIDATERVLYANAVARRVLQLGERELPALQECGARFEIVEGVRAVLAADLARGVKSCRVESQDGDRKTVFLIRAIAEAKLAGNRAAQVVVLEDWTAEERSARAKSEFIYSVSHELKTPLTAIQASLELAAENDGLDPADRDKLVRVSYDESVRLSQMVAELLDLARIEAGITEFKRDTVNVRELLVGLQAMHQSLADKKRIVLKWTVSDYLGDLVGDARLLRQALVNVVGNALKYTKDGGEVALTARLEGHELVTRVRDSGIGIATEDLGRVFEKFFRAKSAQQSNLPGTGLGLPMARYIVERHRGRIEVSSELGVGTEFRIYLPASAADQDEEGTATLLSVDGAAE
jgi:signal transduction histidine kinase